MVGSKGSNQEAHLERRDGDRGRRTPRGIDDGQVLQGRQAGERAVVVDDEGPPDGLQQRQVQLHQVGVLGDLRAGTLTRSVQQAVARVAFTGCR